MRAYVALLLLLWACTDEKVPSATVIINSPADGAMITDHDPINLSVTVTGAPVGHLGVSVNGNFVEGLTIGPPPDGSDCEPCEFSITWSGAEADEGANSLTVFSYNEAREPNGFGKINLRFDDTPELSNIVPIDTEDLTGYGSVTVGMTVVDRGKITATLAIDDEELSPQKPTSCKTGCAINWPWDTSTLAAGNHDLHFTITDGTHTVEQMMTVVLDDVLTITGMQVTNTNEGDDLEIELYVFDNVTNKLLGCAGSAHGLGPINAPNVFYSVNATLIDLDRSLLGARKLAAHAVRLEVWEDDDAPVCPTLFNPNGNDQVGISPARTLAQWKTMTQTMFGNVTDLRLVFERPLSR